MKKSNMICSKLYLIKRSPNRRQNTNFLYNSTGILKILIFILSKETFKKITPCDCVSRKKLFAIPWVKRATPLFLHEITSQLIKVQALIFISNEQTQPRHISMLFQLNLKYMGQLQESCTAGCFQNRFFKVLLQPKMS